MIKQLKFMAIVSMALLTSFCTIQTKSTNGIDSDQKKIDKSVDEKLVPNKYDAFDIVNKGFLDASGNMWFTTLTEGVFRYDGKSFTNFNEKDGLCDNSVATVIEDKDGIIWFGTAIGLCRYDGQSLKNFTYEKKIE